jgi:hypothetical protein
MEYKAFTDDSLKMMYEAVRGALTSDDGLKAQNGEARFRVRETPEWKRHSADLEREMIDRGMPFDVIDWSRGQAPFRVDFTLSGCVGLERLRSMFTHFGSSFMTTPSP